jgi:anti-sigma factor RsiW
MHITENQDALLDYLYEEGNPADRLAIAKHLQECAACAVAVLEFQNVRGMLSHWTPPAADVGFRIVQDAGQSPSESPDHRTRGGWWRGPGFSRATARPWLQAAAAVLLFAAGMAVSQLHVDYGDGRLIVRTRAATPANIRNASITLPPDVNAPNRTFDPDEFERQLIARLGPNASPEQLLQRVRAMIDQSEQRQQRELALRLSQVSREVDTQHQADLLKIQQDFGQQQEALEYLVRTSGGVK